MKPLIVGQAPGPNTDPAVPLSGRCGVRLADLCDLDLETFLFVFGRVNLIPRFPGKAGKGDRFPINAARRGAVNVLLFEAGDRQIVMLGGNVARAFGFPSAVRPFEWDICTAKNRRMAFCPHPSGVNRWWNDSTNVDRARRFWRKLANDAVGAEVSDA